MTDTNMREAFEKWAVSEGMPITRGHYYDVYASAETRAAYLAWQAARAEQAAAYEQKLALMARAVDTDYEQLYREAGERIRQLEDALRSLACSLSAGGYNADVVDPLVFEKKINDGIDMLTAPLQERIRQLEALSSEQRQIVGIG